MKNYSMEKAAQMADLLTQYGIKRDGPVPVYECVETREILIPLLDKQENHGLADILGELIETQRNPP